MVTINEWVLFHGLTRDTYVSSASTKSSPYLQCSATLYRVRPIDYLGICISRQQTAGGLWSITKIIFKGCSRAYKVHVYNAQPLNGSPVFVQASWNSKNTKLATTGMTPGFQPSGCCIIATAPDTFSEFCIFTPPLRRQLYPMISLFRLIIPMFL